MVLEELLAEAEGSRWLRGMAAWAAMREPKWAEAARGHDEDAEELRAAAERNAGVRFVWCRGRLRPCLNDGSRRC